MTNKLGDVVLEKLFGTAVIEKILFYILMNQKTYGAELTSILHLPLYSVQKALERLEDGGIIVAQLAGRTRMYQFNPRYPLLEELCAFLTKAYEFLPEAHKSKFYESPVRRRPRRHGKPLKLVHDD